MSDIRQWLEELGLVQYVDTFEHNEMDIDLVRDLGNEELEKLGVSVMGHRVKMLRAIAALSSPESEIAPATDAGEETTPANKQPAPDAERRQLTVMFCDLVGSTALSERLDPEELRELMQAYRKACADVIGRYDGHVAQYLGDGVMVYFGWPVAHEDDAQRAVRAGLDIVDAIAGLEAPERLEVRIGVATGLVVVGESGADEGADSRLAVGETPNIAARTQGLASPGTVAIAQSTRRLLGGAFALDDLGTHNVKGVSGGLHVHQVLRAAETESRFEASHDAALTPLVGRENEIAMLIERWGQAKDGEGQVVLLSGEAGIGKSRVTQVLRERLSDEPHTWLRYQCSPYYTNSAFYPVIAQLERAAGFARDDDVQARLDKLEALLGQGAADTALFASLLSLPVDRYPPLVLSPQKQKENTVAAVARQVAALAASQPVLMILEDAHWIDPTSLETIGAVIDAIRDHRVLLIITSRPEFESPWGGHAHVTPLTLGRLGRKLGATMVAKVTGGKQLPDEVLDQIVAKTDGIPLFVEELTKTVLEAGFLKEQDGAYVLDGPLPPLAIPSTLQDSLMARLDRLGAAKEVAQIGACIGRTFSHALLALLVDATADELDGSIKALVNSELIFARSTPPTTSYTFRHALTQDTAYSSLLKTRRRAIHERIANSLEEIDPGFVDSHPELLAHHWTTAEQAGRAIPYWLKAGQAAARRSANLEALAHLERGMALLAQLDDMQQRLQLEFALRTTLGTTMMLVKGWTAPEVEDNYDRLLNVSRNLNDDGALFGATWGLWLYRSVSGDLAGSRRLIDDMFVLARKDGANDDYALQAHHAAWATLSWVAEYDAVCRHVEDGLAIYDPACHSDHATRYGGHDPGVCGHAQLGLARWFLGFHDTAIGDAARALDLANEIGHENSVLHAMTWQGLIALFARDTAKAMDLGQRVLGLATDRGLPTYAIMSAFILGGTLAHGSEASVGREQLRSVLAKFDASGVGVVKFMVRGHFAEACRRTGDLDEAAKAIEAAIVSSVATGDVFWLPELKRIQGDILRDRTADTESIESSYHAAIETARGHGSRSLELRAATSLAQLWRSQGKTEQARDLLAPVYDWFTEGFDSADLKDAKALLDELK